MPDHEENPRPPAQTTPIKFSQRTALMGQRAKTIHATSLQAVPHVDNDGYLDHARKHIDLLPNFWGKIAKSAEVLRALSQLVTSSKANLEKDAYEATAVLLNTVSYQYFKTCSRHRKVDRHTVQSAIVFVPTGHKPALGAYLGDELKPDYSAFPVSLAQLELSLRQVYTETLSPLSDMNSVGEHKRDKEKLRSNDDYAQLASYLDLLKRYRPDLPTVHGFQVSQQDMRLASLNACGMWRSTVQHISNVDMWIAHVLLVYRAYDKRDNTLCYRPLQENFGRWDVHLNNDVCAVVPFQVTHAPGRVTFASFELQERPSSQGRDEEQMDDDFYHGEASGFFKMSWQDTTSSSKESELLEELHKGAYLPGLVRPRFTSRDGAADAVYVPEDEGGIRRVKEIVHLGSVGEPLSQAASPRHLLYMGFDLVDTLEAMFDRFTLHRDVSWYNVLVYPVHHVDDGRGVVPRTCISEIMHHVERDLEVRPFGRKKTFTAGQSPFESTVLLIDLDHAINITRDGATRRNRTGTQMFIAVEMSNAGAPDMLENPDLNGAQLRDWLTAVETSPEGRAAFEKAFPDGDDGFMDDFDGIIREECERRRARDASSDDDDDDDDDAADADNGKRKHENYHDLESALWILLWAFARARPSGAALEAANSREMQVFNPFCHAMFRHATAMDSVELPRAKYLFISSQLRRLFHPRLKRFEMVFRAMATYLSIPWHLYAGRVKKKHAFVAFKRLILAALVHSSPGDLDIQLDTAQPRVTTALDEMLRNKAVKSATRAKPANEQPAALARTLESMHNGSRSKSKRKADASGSRDDHPPPLPKKAKANSKGSRADSSQTASGAALLPLAGPSAHVLVPAQPPAQIPAQPPALDDSPAMAQAPCAVASSQTHDNVQAQTDAQATVDQPVPSDDDDRAKKDEVVYDPEQHLFGRSAHILRLKFWKDSDLWFGRGTRDKPKAG